MLRTVSVRLAIAFTIVASAAACGGGRREHGHGSRIERTIERELATRVHAAVHVRCAWIPPACVATVEERGGARLPIRIGVERGGLVWRLDGVLVRAADLEAYLQDELEELGAPQQVRCGARIAAVAAGDRIECMLADGGRAFVIANADGSTAIEIELDRAAGEARSEPVTLERDDLLLEMSRQLDEPGADGDHE